MFDRFVFAYRKEGNSVATIDSPYIMRSYNHYLLGTDRGLETNGRIEGPLADSYPRNPGAATKFPTWKVAMAATAAPLYFAPMEVLVKRHAQTQSTNNSQMSGNVNDKVTFIDGGFGRVNNPSEEAFHEVNSSNEKIGTFVSIGTGRDLPNRHKRRTIDVIRAGFDVAGDPDPAHQAVKRESEREAHEFSYFRLNEPGGLHGLDFDEWKPKATGEKTKKKITSAFNCWVENTRSSEIQRLATELVRRRRLRSLDESRWERYALESSYDCDCYQAATKRWENRNEYVSHLMQHHAIYDEAEQREEIERHRIIRDYKPPSHH